MSLTFFDLPMILPLLALVLARVTGLFLTAPALNSSAIPVRVKVYAALAVSLVVLPNLLGFRPALTCWIDLLAGVAAELALGAIFGFLLNFMFVGLQMGAHVISQQAGLALAEVFNPAFESDTDILGGLYYWVALMAFFAAGGQRLLVGSILRTFDVLPVMGYSWPSSTLELLMQAAQACFELAVHVAWPVLLALLLAELALGFISRTMPQINILMVGFSLRILVGLLAVALTMAAATHISLLVGDDILQSIGAVLGGPADAS